jgi:hypothetical protein
MKIDCQVLAGKINSLNSVVEKAAIIVKNIPSGACHEFLFSIDDIYLYRQSFILSSDVNIILNQNLDGSLN